MQLKTEYEKIKHYITKDGSIIRELMHPSVHGNSNHSLAEAIVPAGGKTLLHKHRLTEEIYHLKEGSGIMTLGGQEFEVYAGNTVCIKPGTPHSIRNTGENDLKVLCCCVPAYSHEDTELME